MPELFNNLDFEACVNLISIVAWTFPGEEVFRQMLHIDQKENAKTHSLLMKAFNIFMDWPIKFHDYLFSLLDKVKTIVVNVAASTSSKMKERNLFETFYKKLYDFSGSQYDLVRGEFEIFLSNNWKLVYKKRNQKTDFHKLPFYTLTTIHRKFGVQGNRVEKYIERGIFKAVEINIKGKIIKLFHKDSVDSLMKMHRESLSREEAGKILGIYSFNILVELHHAGCMKAVRGPEIDGYGRWRFDSSSVYKVLECFEQSTVLKEITNKKLVRFKNINIKIDGYIPGYVEIISKVQNGDLKPCGKVNNQNGLNKYCFDRMDLREAFSEEIKSVYSNELSLNEAARSLKMHKGALSYLLDNGYLKYIVKSKRIKCISLNDINEFNTKYVSLSELLRNTKTNGLGLIKILETNGFKPLNGKKNSANHFFLFERSREIEGFLIKHFGLK